MKYVFIFLLVLIVPNFCFGARDYQTTYNDVVEEDSTFKYIDEFNKLTKERLPVLEERVRQTNPELVAELQNENADVKLVKYNNYLAEKMFYDYQNLFLWDMQEKSKQTGRQIKYANNVYGDGELLQWLDRGILDTSQCEVTYTPKDYSEKEMKKYRQDEYEHTCLYPDGFEEYEIKAFTGGNHPALHVHIDDKAKNTHTYYHVMLDIDSDKDLGNAIMVDVFTSTNDYKQFYAWRNQMQQDFKDGYDNPMLQCSGKKCDELEWVAEETIDVWNRKVKSTDMVPQGTKVKGIVLDRKFR